MEFTEEQIFYFVVIVLGLPAILVALKLGAFIAMPKFILRAFFMKDYNTKRKKDQKRKDREAKKRKRRGEI